MPGYSRWFLELSVWFLGLTLLTSAEAAQVQLVSGIEHRGEVRRISHDGLEMRTENGEELKIPLDEVLLVRLREASRPLPANVPALRVVLVDGSQLQCQAMGLRGAQVDLRLFSGMRVALPLTHLTAVLCEAHEAKNLVDFELLMTSKPRTDVVKLLSRDGQNVNTFEGILGEADAAGETIRFTPDGGDPAQLSLARVRLLWFARPNPTLAPRVGWVRDLYHNRFAVARIDLSENQVVIHTPAGTTLTLPTSMVGELDLSAGKQAYLSDLDPVRVSESAALVDIWRKRWRRDRTLTGGPVSLGQRQFAKGLALQARVELEFDVTGYSLFRAVAGIDDQISQGNAVLVIQADGKDLLRLPLHAQAETPPEIELKISGSKRLRILVDFGDGLDLGAQVLLGDARVLR